MLQDLPAHPGCPAPASFCDASHPESQNPGKWCGFDGWPIGAWAAKDLAVFIALHNVHGTKYQRPGLHSGYNEVVLSSEKYNTKLPHTIDAFFVLSTQTTGEDGAHVSVGAAHKAFLEKYGLTPRQVPLLQFDPGNWAKPFSEITNSLLN